MADRNPDERPTSLPAETSERSDPSAQKRGVNLALQGGGVHGAFTWGVLDKLLEDGRLSIEAISATSAGAINATVLAWGMSQGGRDGARALLAALWRQIGNRGELWGLPWPKLMDFWLAPGGWPEGVSPGYLMFQAMTHTLSPYQLNPLDLNPLRELLVEIVDFDALRQCPKAPRLFINATNVRSGKIKVFENRELSAEAVLASACLPEIFKAVEVDGEAYWDGGFMGNPAIFPLIYAGAARDVIIVHINPIVQDRLPKTAPEIFDRMNEISFNSSLMREMRAIAFVSRLIDEERLDGQRYKRMLIHAIADDDEMRKHGAWSKLNPDASFIAHLFGRGRQAADRWLQVHANDVGQRSTVDIGATYL